MSGSECGSVTVVLTCCSQSHPFDDRRIFLGHEPQKIGRSVAKVKPTADNLIFDCKVLSRNHAVIWYDSDGRVYLKDTKSSNGTFINNQRLSKGGEDSAPRDLYSCDIVQFGVDIMENKKITHGCIVAMVRLFDASGRELEVRGTQPQTSVTHFDVATLDNRESTGAAIQELYQLQQYIKEAAHREQLLESKLAMLQNILENTIQASSTSWQALVDEDRLLSRIETLEAQLALYSKGTTDEVLREEVRRSHDEREKFEGAAKESLRAALQEKVEAVQKLADVERSLETTEEECARLKAECSFSQSELGSLAQKYAEVLNEIHELSNRLEDAEKNYSELESRAANEHVKFLSELSEMSSKENIFKSKIESLQADNDFTKEQLAFMRVRVEQLKQAQTISPVLHDSCFATTDIIQSNPDEAHLNDEFGEHQVQLETYRSKLEESQGELAASRRIITDLQDQLRRAKDEMVDSKTRAGVLDDRIRDSNAQINMMIETATEQLKVQLNEAMRQKEMSDHLCRRLEEEIVQKENILKTLRSGNGTISPSAIRRIAISSYGSQRSPVIHSSTPDIHSSSSTENGLQGVSTVPDLPTPSTNNACGSAKLQDASDDDRDATWPPDPCDVATLQTHLAKAVQSKLLLEAELCKYKEELDLARSLQNRSQEDALGARRQLHDIQNQHSLAMEKIDHLEGQLRSEKERRKLSVVEADQFKVQLQDAQQHMNHVATESEELKNKLKLITEELEFERSLRSTSDLDNDNARIALHRQAAKNQAEFAGLKEECVSLRNRIIAIEKEMRTSRKENCRLSTEYRRLQESYRDLEKLKDGLETKENSFSTSNADVALAPSLEGQPSGSDSAEIMLLRKVTNDQKIEISSLREKLSDENYDFNYEELRWQTQTVAVLSFIPLFILLIAFLLAFLPFFAAITGTAEPPSVGSSLFGGSDDPPVSL